MTEESQFGDWEPEDSYSPDNDPDPFQVARRVHEDRTAIDMLTGKVWLRWPQLSDQEREIAVYLGTVVVRSINGSGSVEGVAKALHDARVELDPDLTPWDDLDDDAREFATKLMQKTIDWLSIEGTFI